MKWQLLPPLYDFDIRLMVCHMHCIFILKAESDPAPAGMKTARRTTLAGGARIDLLKVAQEQQMKMQMEESLASVRAKQEGQLGVTLSTYERDGEVNTVSGTRQSSVATSAKYAQAQPTVDDPMHKKHERSVPADFRKGKVNLCPTTHFHIIEESLVILSSMVDLKGGHTPVKMEGLSALSLSGTWGG